MRRTVEIGDSRIPIREVLGLVATLLLAFGLLAIAANEAGSTAHGWVVFVVASTASILVALTYTAILIRQKRFVLRDKDAIEQNRKRIAGVGVPVGYAILAAIFFVGWIIGDLGGVLIPSILGGMVLGLWPGMLANFLRLRREKWSGSGDEVS